MTGIPVYCCAFATTTTTKRGAALECKQEGTRSMDGWTNRRMGGDGDGDGMGKASTRAARPSRCAWLLRCRSLALTHLPRPLSLARSLPSFSSLLGSSPQASKQRHQDRSPITNHQSPITNHQSPITKRSQASTPATHETLTTQATHYHTPSSSRASMDAQS